MGPMKLRNAWRAVAAVGHQGVRLLRIGDDLDAELAQERLDVVGAAAQQSELHGRPQHSREVRAAATRTGVAADPVTAQSEPESRPDASFMASGVAPRDRSDQRSDGQQQRPLR